MTPPDAVSIGRAVAAAMVRRAVRTTELADHLDLTRPALSRRLHGHVEFRGTELAAAAVLLRVAPGAFFDVSPPLESPCTC